MRRSVLFGLCTIAALVHGRAEADPNFGPAYFAGRSAQTAFDMIQLLPAFTFSEGDPATRGYSGSAGNVLIDGERPSDKRYKLSDVLAHIPADQVDHIEIIRNARPGLDMMGQQVLANVVRKSGADDSTVATVFDEFWRDGRHFPGATVEFTRHWSGGRTLSAALSASRYGEWAEGKGDLTLSDGAGRNLGSAAIRSSADGVNAYGYAALTGPLAGGNLALNASVSRTDYSYRETDLPGDGGPEKKSLHQYLGGPLGGQLQAEIGAHYNRAFGHGWSSESVMLAGFKGQSYKSRLSQNGAGQDFLEHEVSGETLLRSALRNDTSSDLSAQISLEGAYNWLNTESRFSYGGFDVPLPNARANVSELRGQMTSAVTWKPTPRLQLDGGMDVEASFITAHADSRKTKTLSFLKPHLSMNLSLSGQTQLRLKAAREAGQLDFADYVASSALDLGRVNAGNTDITPQRHWLFSATLEQHFWSEGALSVTYKRLLISDAIDRVPITAPEGDVYDAPGNIGAGRIDAAVLDLTLPLQRLGLDHTQVKVSATWQWSSVKDPTTGEKRPISGLNPREYSLTLRRDVPAWKASFGLTLATPCAADATAKGCTHAQYRFDEIDRYRADPALGVFAEFELWAGTLVRFDAKNILEQRYDRDISYYSGPRNAAGLASQEARRLSSSAAMSLKLRKVF